ncbi:MAG: NusG domain II-containing protein [Clostridia bacterium]|nr:NusG domain II-containing protein [Clostridia bacterium]
MEQITTGSHRRRNWVLTGTIILLAALAVVILFLLRPKTGMPDRFVIYYGDGKTLTVSAWETRTVVIRDGEIVEEATGEGEENVIRIENGEAWMEHANCRHGECVEQGRLNAESVKTRPLGTWIICAPHRVNVEYRGIGQ